MTNLFVEGPFDLDHVAAAFPDQLTFRGDHASSDGITEIEGAVDRDALKASVTVASAGPIIFREYVTTTERAPVEARVLVTAEPVFKRWYLAAAAAPGVLALVLQLAHIHL